ncbi:MAG TPA: HdeD family acid-resistance protein [Myxococcales bacterium]|nr:HdeD family acid-resistance protein [Myxococcales bacterium]
MLETLKRGWWLLILRGVCAVLFGVLAFVKPGAAGEVLVLLFGAYALVNGIFTLGLAMRAPKGMPGKGSLVVLGLLGVAAGVLTFFYPGVTALSLLWVIAFWAIFTGIFEISVAIKLRKELSNEWMIILGGVLSAVFGVLVIAMPRAGALSIVWLIGTYAILYGVMLLTAAIRLRSLLSEARSAARLA